MAFLGWQSYRSISQQRQLVQKVLLEYTQLAIEEYSRRIMSDIGYQQYFKHLEQWQNKLLKVTTSTPMELFERITCDADNKGQLGLFYLLKKPSIDIAEKSLIQPQKCATKENYQEILNILAQFDMTQLADKPFTVLHQGTVDKPISLVLTKYKEGFFGFVVNRKYLVNALKESFNRAPLLPVVLANGLATNQMLALTISDHKGVVLFNNQQAAVPMESASKLLGEEYNGLFNQHKITAYIKKENAGQLIIGGLPDNNIMIILLTMLVALSVFTVSLQLLKKEKKLNQLRENFVAEVSHELRTPLTQIKMFAEMLQRGRTRNSAETKEYTNIIYRESLRLQYLIDNILKYSENDLSSKSQLQRQNIAPIITQAVREFTPIAQQKDVSFELSVKPYELALNHQILFRIILNLLDNAIKYGPNKQTVTIHAAATTKGYNLIISDQGPGIPKHQREKIWQAYYRLPGENEAAISGTGIGLYLVKQLISQINASISLRTNETGGCCFILEWETLT